MSMDLRFVMELVVEIGPALEVGEHGTPERYARTSPSFEVGDPRYAWLERSIFVGTLERDTGEVPAVRLRYYEVL
jgi:hypothetical protein